MKLGYKARSVTLPEWIDQVIQELAQSYRRSKSAQIEVLVEEQLRRLGYAPPSEPGQVAGGGKGAA